MVEINANIPEELYVRLNSFRTFLEQYLDLDEPLDQDSYIEILLDQALNRMLADFLEPQEKDTLIKSVQRLVEKYPDILYNFLTRTTKRGQKLRAEADWEAKISQLKVKHARS